MFMPVVRYGCWLSILSRLSRDVATHLSFDGDTHEFITLTIKRILDVDVSGGYNFNNFTKVLDTFLTAARNFMETLSRYPDHFGVNLLGKAVDEFIDLVALMFWKKTS